MAEIPKTNFVQIAIENRIIPNPHRAHIGASSLGHICDRAIWLSFYWAYENTITPRVARIFERGEWEEERVIRDLMKAGMRVDDMQVEFTDETGHIMGHVDGFVTNVPGAEKTKHLLEVKTANSKRYAEFLKKGIKSFSIEYYVQINMYMGWSKTTRCLFIICNKDTEERCYTRVHYDPDCFHEYSTRALRILTSPIAPDKIGNRTYQPCKLCSAYEFCHGDMPLSRNCRTCIKCDITNLGHECTINGNLLSVYEQRAGCEFYEPAEGIK